ncbi:ankyrin repeat-containing domain protein [Aspergillus keveii]|uniref:Ankyrin repeat-containing domain protein n=1 Tax=Aspergillus keveii TaxID=714993 RepID=A0ABR4FN00_9EURO
MGITDLPAELLYAILDYVAPKSLDWAYHYAHARWFLHLRFTCKSFDTIIISWFLANLKSREQLNDCPVTRLPLRPSATAMCVRLLSEQLRRDGRDSQYSLISIVADGARMASEVLGQPTALCETALMSSIVGVSGTWLPLAHLAGIEEDQSAPLEEKYRYNVALIVAATMGSLEGINCAIKMGADVNFEPGEHWLGTPLFAAAFAGQTAAIQLLVDCGADANYVCTQNGETALHYAATSGSESAVALLLNLGLDPDARNHQKDTPLIWAAAAGYVGTTRLLLAQPTDVNAQCASGKTALLYAAWRKHEDVAHLLLERPEILADHKDPKTKYTTALAAAALTGSEALFNTLIAREDVDPHVTDETGHGILKHAITGGNEAIVRAALLRTNVNAHGEDGSTPLMWAAKVGSGPLVRLLLAEKNIRVNRRGEEGVTALMLAVVSHSLPAVKALLEWDGINVNARCEENADMLEGTSALGVMAVQGLDEMARVFLEHRGVNSEIRDMHGRTPLGRAARSSQLGMVRLLLERGDVDVNAPDNSGLTPLMHAVEVEAEPVVRHLLRHEGIQVATKDHDGQTALAMAASYGNEPLIRVLLDATPGFNKADIEQARRVAEEGGYTAVQRTLSSHLKELYGAEYVVEYQGHKSEIAPS